MKKRFLSYIYFTLFILVVTAISCDKNEDETNKKPTCSITSPLNGEEFISQDTITITVDASDSDGEITEVIFFADGEVLDIKYTAPYVYHWEIEEVSSGNHSIRASSRDDRGGSNMDEININIIQIENAPIADFYATSATSGQAPLFLHFVDQSTNEPTSWSWDFGDGGSNNSQHPYHTFSTVGTFTVTLTATNAFGSDSETKIDLVTTLPGGHIAPFTDSRDGQVYDSIRIGDQTWMINNLNYITEEGSWDYDNDTSLASVYGRLYNYETAKTSCPEGWHLPYDSEWKTLEKYIGMSQTDADKIGWRGTNQGGELKISGTDYWMAPNQGANNAAHFYALPGGQYFNGYFGDMTTEAYFWTASSNGITNAYYRKLHFESAQVGRSNVGDVDYGFSVRCVKNVP